MAALLLCVACAGVKSSGSTGQGGSTTGTGGAAGAGGGTTSSGMGGTKQPPPQPGVCSGLRCQQNSCTMGNCTAGPCPGGGTTSLSGTVYDPAGKNPLYDVVVYVPNAPLQALPDGITTCETCSGNFSGSPIAVTLTDAAGHFKLDDVPVGDNIPVVVQIGKWRRQFTMPNVPNCVETPVTDKDLTRLPRNKSEGHIPKIAIAAGGSDALECLLRKIGLDDAEFTGDSGDGRVQIFWGHTTDGGDTAKATDAGSPLESYDQLWSSADSMKRYDLVLMACEGKDNYKTRTTAQFTAVRDYVDVGGRVFTSHYHDNWFRSEDGKASAGYPQVVKFASGGHGLLSPIVLNVDATFPKGMAFQDWLVNVGASTMPGQISITDGEHTIDSVIQGITQQWIYGTDTGRTPPTVVEYASFTAPPGGMACGRAVMSDVHASLGGGTLATVPFPTRCGTLGADLTPQEKALEFMLFDISSCVQKDDQPVMPPPIVE